MKTSQLLARLRSLGVKLWVDGCELGISAPKGVLDAELVAELRAKKSEILALLANSAPRAAAASEGADEIPAIEPAEDRRDALPLSFSQKRLWFLDQLEPKSCVYNMPLAWTLRGTLDVECLERAVARVVERHAVLRTSFPDDAGTPREEVGPVPPFDLRPTIPPGANAAERREALRVQLSERAEEPFELARGPLLRPALFRIEEDEHVLFLLVHHIVFDGWSADVFLREVGEVYRALVSGTEPELDPLPIQYADFACWQESFFASAPLQEQLRYHAEQLAGDLPILDLPSDRPRPPVQSYRGANLRRALTPELLAEVKAVARREGATLYMVLLAAYDLLLARWSRREEAIVGTIVAGRNRPETRDLIGFFANTLVLRTDLSGNPSFTELVARVKETALGAFEHQDLPFEKLVEELAPERNLSHTPIFQTIFMLEDRTGKEGRFGDLELELFELEAHVARTDLMWTAHETEAGGLEMWAEYSTDLFDPETIERLFDSYIAILEGAVANPDAPAMSLPLLSPAERRRLLEDWRGPMESYPEDPIHAQFEARVDAAPDALALVFPTTVADGAGDEELTFSELDERANRIANLLVERGVRPGDLVGLCLERSVDMVAAVLAIQKAGGAYVPLDPAYPTDRLAHMVADSGLALCVTHSELTDLLPDGIDHLALDREAGALAAASPGRPAIAVASSERCYVIYTSGSTGRPKGVELEHRSVSNFLATMAKEPGFEEGTRLLALTTLSFDISVLELMLPLTRGGTLIVAPGEATADGEALLALMERLEPDIMQATPATWRLLLLSGWEGSPNLRVFSGGEALALELAEEIVPRCKELWNLYGPTETTIWSTRKRIEEGSERITIGKPIANTSCYVLDERREPVPVGVPGELWIGGHGLARGYLDREQLTAERFVPDPFAEGPIGGRPARMYRTGDEARWLPSGELECLGRIDHQVKLRGFRIELGEIESVLAEHPAVRQCVCVVREDVPGDQRLTAYVLGDEDLDAEPVRAHARELLPGYMIPSAIVRLDELPHTPNGKVDRGALRKLEPPGAAQAAGDEEHVEPRTATERAIAEVWADVLQLDRVDVEKNFFDLGGHSLLLAEVLGRLKESLNGDLTIVELFRYSTVASLAERIDSRGADGASGGREEKTRDLARGRQTLMQRRRIRR
ncbi:MAG TPA: amino acid adenylation domain-containing protein [Planctomycetes bacterium]|nr:amino acid adenylation domain-containing protein [Planctomycetota bacterium]